jgi:hypothetical protein
LVGKVVGLDVLVRIILAAFLTVLAAGYLTVFVDGVQQGIYFVLAENLGHVSPPGI